MTGLKQALMERDGMFDADAEALIEDMKMLVRNGEDPADVLGEICGLEEHADDLKEQQ